MTLPLTMNGRLSECLLLSYRTPARTVRNLIPRCMELVTCDGWAFWNVVACTVENMRPAGVPRRLGVSYHHVAYRLLVKARTADGETLRGLYFVRSDADSRLISKFGNAMTDFRFHPAAVEFSRADDNGSDLLTVSVQGPGDDGKGDALARVLAPRGDGNGAADTVPPLGSPFRSAAEAAEFLKYCPLGLSVDLDGRYLRLAEVVRDEKAWREQPVRVIEAHWPFLRELGQDQLHLERATRVAPIDYKWRLGRRAAVAPLTASPPTRRKTESPAHAAAA
jgi:hypothetical protein